jgi:hypothetical protein
MSIPKIAISNDDDSSLQILQVHSTSKTAASTPPSPFKSIIKNRSSQPVQASSASTTTHTYYTCQTRQDTIHSNEPWSNSSIRQKPVDQFHIRQQRMIDENDTENDVSELSQVDESSKTKHSNLATRIPRRRGTISTTSVLPSHACVIDEQTSAKPFRLRKNRSFTIMNSERSTMPMSTSSSRNSFVPHGTTPPPPWPYAEKDTRHSLTRRNHGHRSRTLNPVRRTNSYRPSTSSTSSATLRRFIVHDGKLIEQTIDVTNANIKRRSTLDNSSYPMTQIETSSIYETPPQDDHEQYMETNSSTTIRLVTHANRNIQLLVNDQSDMQLNLISDKKRQQRIQQPVGVSRVQ